MSAPSFHDPPLPPPARAITDRLRSCRRVLGAIDRYREELTAGLAESFRPWLAAEPGRPFEAILTGLRESLVAVRDRLVDRDLACRTGLRSVIVSRDLRAAAVSALRAAVGHLRDTFRGVYGAANLKAIGFAGNTPRQPASLVQWVGELRDRLSDPGLVLPPSRLHDFELDAPHLAKTLVSPRAALVEADDAVAHREAEVDDLEAERGRSLAEFNKTFVRVAGTVESFFRLVELDDVADEVRPSLRRPGVTETLPQEESVEGGEASG